MTNLDKQKLSDKKDIGILQEGIIKLNGNVQNAKKKSTSRMSSTSRLKRTKKRILNFRRNFGSRLIGFGRQSMKLTREKRQKQTNISEEQVLPAQSNPSSATDGSISVSESAEKLSAVITKYGNSINDDLDLIFKVLSKLIKENTLLEKRIDELEKKECKNGI